MSYSVNLFFQGAYHTRIAKNSENLVENKCATERCNQIVKEMYKEENYKGVAVTISEEGLNLLTSEDGKKKMLRDVEELFTKNATVLEADPNDIFSLKANDQWLIFSEFLYNNGFYDSLSNTEVKEIESLLIKITNGLDSLCQTGIDLYGESHEQLSSSEAYLELESSTSALQYFCDKFVASDKKDDFRELISKYYEHNCKVIQGYSSIEENFNKGYNKLPSEAKVRLEKGRSMFPEALRNEQAAKELAIRNIFGGITHSSAEIEAQNKLISSLFSSMNKNNIDIVIQQIKNSFIDFTTSNSKNDDVITFVRNKSEHTFANITKYWSDLFKY
ncbi:hypothetical protein EHE19_010420 [Ruminiclostridium herbifermentans]|uniref:Uncharacterized protein n=1 Tax=Ruminiclostridium herbifermentans TaxID=2488810 RepID=A0A4U7JMG7_9FIRM|nr:hypothetical protein [Ruminiclostridium herbifermentans]QNU65354.1 hypothetical protein EHE19_010420 [Ruminiclostridium herbifermentans]